MCLYGWVLLLCMAERCYFVWLSVVTLYCWVLLLCMAECCYFSDFVSSAAVELSSVSICEGPRVVWRALGAESLWLGVAEENGGKRSTRTQAGCIYIAYWHSALFTVSLFNTLQPSGHYMYRQFNTQQFYVLSKQCIYVFCVDLRTNSDYFPIQH